MEFDLIFLLMILAFYFLSHLGGKKRRQSQQQTQRKQPTQPGAPVPEAKQDPDLDDALREIREALGWPSQTPTPTQRPEPVETVERPPLEPRPTAAPTPRKVETPVGDRRSETQQRRSPAPVADRYARYTGVGGAAEAGAEDRKTGIPELKNVQKRKGTHPVLKQLQDREGARNAVVLAEILNEPAWKQRGFRRR